MSIFFLLVLLLSRTNQFGTTSEKHKTLASVLDKSSLCP
jgi:hypothetical protein